MSVDAPLKESKSTILLSDSDKKETKRLVQFVDGGISVFFIQMMPFSLDVIKFLCLV